MNLQEKRMNLQERKEWEALCRQYNVDSLQEAIQGCREELEFLIHCAERLEPPTEQDEDSKKRRLTHTRNAAFPHWKRRLTDAGNAVSPCQIQRSDYFLTEYNFINIYQYQVWKIGDLLKKTPTI